ncbi:MAG: hypothetical protein GXO44_01340 [Deferribacteres bacterium]|nr:hypothetical protein [Deferribacteres bacterium]
MQRFIWWVVFLLFTAFVLLSIFVLTTTVAANPEAVAFVISLMGFWLFANRLIFGFGGIANAASAFVRGEVVDKDRIVGKIAADSHMGRLQKLYELEVVALLGMWRSGLEAFKYTYYFAFFIVLLIATLFELNVISSLVFGPVVKAFMFGAAVPTLIVWGLELLSNYYLAKALEKVVEDAREVVKGEKEALSLEG